MSGIEQSKVDFTGLLAGAVGLVTVGALLAGLNAGIGVVRHDVTDPNPASTAITEPSSASMRIIPLDEMTAAETFTRANQTTRHQQGSENSALSPTSKASATRNTYDRENGKAVAFVLPDLADVPPTKPQRNIARANAIAHVTRFDACMPACETHDPLIASGQASRGEAPQIVQPELELIGVERVSAIASATEVITQAADVPIWMASIGRSVLKNAAQILR